MHAELWWGNLSGNIHLEDREGDGRLKDLSKISSEDKMWMELAQDRVQWQALVLAVLNLLVLLPQC